MSIETLIRKNIIQLIPYSTARDEYKGKVGIYFDANENPFDNNINRYPDPKQKILKKRIAEIKGIAAEHIFIGNGSDEAIDIMFRIFCTPGKDHALSIAPTYGMYKVAAAINDVIITEIPLNKDFSLSANAILEAVKPNTKLIFLCSPNNPSGNLLSASEIQTIINHFKGIVVLDEAYIDFAQKGSSFVNKLYQYENLVILQTLSKAWGMAGIRLGLAFASTLIINIMNKVKYPYNINILTQEKALQQLNTIDIKKQINIIISERNRMTYLLSSLPFVKKVFLSDANFLLVKVDQAHKLYNQLIEKGFIVRDRSTVKGCEDCLRITIGTPEQNELLIKAIKV